jgi:hypothetical protein
MLLPTSTDSPDKSRILEIGQILGAGLIRLFGRKSSGKFAEHGESSLDLSAHESGHPTPKRGLASGG